MNAHRLVIIAAAFTIVGAAPLATALVTFSSQALPRAVRHDLSRATGTSFVIRGNVTAAQGAQYTSLLPGKISAALEGAPFTFYRAYRSDPLGFVAGSRPAAPGNTPPHQSIRPAPAGNRAPPSDHRARRAPGGARPDGAGARPLPRRPGRRGADPGRPAG